VDPDGRDLEITWANLLRGYSSMKNNPHPNPLVRIFENIYVDIFESFLESIGSGMLNGNINVRHGEGLDNFAKTFNSIYVKISGDPNNIDSTELAGDLAKLKDFAERLKNFDANKFEEKVNTFLKSLEELNTKVIEFETKMQNLGEKYREKQDKWHQRAMSLRRIAAGLGAYK
jgi:glutamate synthase domain-containing protein 3